MIGAGPLFREVTGAKAQEYLLNLFLSPANWRLTYGESTLHQFSLARWADD